MMMYGAIPVNDRYKKSIVGKLPVWAWWIIYFLLSVGGNFFSNQIQINTLPFQFLGSESGAAEAGNLMWAHAVFGVISLVYFELILFLYYQISFAATKGGVNVSRQEFTGIFRAFYCAFLVASGVFQLLYFNVSVSYVWGKALFGMVGRFLTVTGLLWYLKKYCIESRLLPRAVLGIYVPYLAIELINLFYSIL